MRKDRLRIYTFRGLKRKLTIMAKRKAADEATSSAGTPDRQAVAAAPAEGPPAADGAQARQALTPEQIALALAAPFAPEKIGWKPQSVSGNRCLAIAYIDARDVMDRLDGVLGVQNWQDSYHDNQDGTVACTLEVRIGGEWIAKVDVGGESDQKDAGDKRKAAYSDALKRAAVKFGVGRYLYSLGCDWVDYDPQKRAIVRPPRLPDWALPESHRAHKPALPGLDFHAKVVVYDRDKGYQGDLIRAIAARGKEIGAPDDMTLWNQEQVEAARKTTKVWEQRRNQARAS